MIYRSKPGGRFNLFVRLLVVIATAGAVLSAQDTPFNSSQPVPPTPAPLTVKAAIVLSRDFCATEQHESLAVMEVFKVGEALCRQLPPALSPIFVNLQRLDKAPAADTGGPEIVMIPRFVDLAAVQPPHIDATPSKLLILLEWTIQDSSRNVVWLGTMRGAYEQKLGTVDTGKVQALLEGGVAAVVEASVSEISRAPEVRRLAH